MREACGKCEGAPGNWECDVCFGEGYLDYEDDPVSMPTRTRDYRSYDTEEESKQ